MQRQPRWCRVVHPLGAGEAEREVLIGVLCTWVHRKWTQYIAQNELRNCRVNCQVTSANSVVGTMLPCGAQVGRAGRISEVLNCLRAHREHPGYVVLSKLASGERIVLAGWSYMLSRGRNVSGPGKSCCISPPHEARYRIEELHVGSLAHIPGLGGIVAVEHFFVGLHQLVVQEEMLPVHATTQVTLKPVLQHWSCVSMRKWSTYSYKGLKSHI